MSKVIFLPSSAIINGEIRNRDVMKNERPEISRMDRHDEEICDIDINEMVLPSTLIDRMLLHQKIGVCWLYKLFQNKSGGILGDDMGLGKTFQVVCLLTALFRSLKIKRVLIICPVAVLQNWVRELNEFLVPNANRNVVIELLSSEVSKKRRQNTIRFSN